MATQTTAGARCTSATNTPGEVLMTITRSLAVTTTLAALLATPVAMGTAQAKGTGVAKSGTCAGGNTHYTLKAKHDNGLIEVEWQVDSNRAGQVWSVRLRDNGNLFFSANRTTQAPSGSFTVHRNTANRAGSDVIRARTVHSAQTCVASVTVCTNRLSRRRPVGPPHGGPPADLCWAGQERRRPDVVR